jgi:hypothetical protein
MKRILAMLLAAAFGLPAIADDPPKKTVPDKPPETKKDDEKKPETRAEKFAAIRKEMSAELQPIIKEINAEKEASKRKPLMDQYYDTQKKYAAMAIAFAKENPKDDVAFDAIQLAISAGQGNESSKSAIGLLMAHHVENPKLADRIAMFSRDSSKDTESFLHAVMARNPEKTAKGRAAYFLLQLLANKIENTKSDAVASTFEKEATVLLKRMETEFAEVPLTTVPPNSKVKPRLLGKLAATEAKGIANIKNLKVGKPIPEIEGPDMDGKTFKISDYKGKVVLLDFWGHW